MDKKQIIEEFREKFSYIRADVYGDGHEQDITDTLEQWLSNKLDEVEKEVKNNLYFESPEYLTSEAHSVACTINQRVNQNNYNNSKKEWLKEIKKLSNKLVSLTKQINNLVLKNNK